MEILQFPVTLIDTVAISTGPTFVKMITAQVLNYCPRANGAKRHSGHKPGARITNSARLFIPGFINIRGRMAMVHGQ